MNFGLLLPFVVLTLIILGIRQLRSSGGRGAIHGQSVRRFFQYALLFGLIVIVAIGLSGLLGRLLSRDLVIRDQTELARNFSFVVVGVPLYILGIFWTRRKYEEDRSEARSFGWALYFTLVPLTALISSMVALVNVLAWALGTDSYNGFALSQFIVWSLVWSGHWWVNSRFTPVENSRTHFLAGSLIGLGTGAFGFEQLLASFIDRVFHFGGNAIIVSSSNPTTRGAIIFAVGALVWFVYWIETSFKSVRESMWLAYVLLAGVAGGLLVAVVAVSTTVYTTLVWFIGTPGISDAAIHFKSIPSSISACVVGLVIWWYHRAIIHDGESETRTEVKRIYQYLMAGVGLLAAAAGLAIILVALIEGITSSALIAGEGSVNSLLAAGTLLVVGIPIWWSYWRRIQLCTIANPSEEHASPTRRIYLFLLFGIGGLTAVIALLLGVFFVFDDVFKSNFGADTLRRMRFPIGLLVSTGAVAGYHWVVYRTEREHMVTALLGPRLVLLIGPKDPEFARQLARKTGAKVQSWTRSDLDVGPWSLDVVIKALENTKDDGALIVAEPNGARVIPIDLS